MAVCHCRQRCTSIGGSPARNTGRRSCAPSLLRSALCTMMPAGCMLPRWACHCRPRVLGPLLSLWPALVVSISTMNSTAPRPVSDISSVSMPFTNTCTPTMVGYVCGCVAATRLQRARDSWRSMLQMRSCTRALSAACCAAEHCAHACQMGMTWASTPQQSTHGMRM